MPTSVSTGAYIAALHKKLAQAERSLYEFRAIFEHFQETLRDGPEEAPDPVTETRERCQLPEGGREPRGIPAERVGLFPGQYDNMVDTSDIDDDVEVECVE